MAEAQGSARRSLLESPGNGGFRFNCIRLVSLSATLPALLAGPAWAARWDIVPTASVRETYTDNVSLTPDSLRQSDWVTQLIPGIAIAATGARLRFNFNYAPEVTYYARGSNDNQVFNRGNAIGVAELAEKLLFVEAGGLVDQYNISSQGPITVSNINTTGNRATVGSYYASPYLRRAFGSEVQAEARYTYSVVNTNNNSELENNVADRIYLRLASGPAYKLLTWDLAYTREHIRYETQQDTDTEVICGERAAPDHANRRPAGTSGLRLLQNWRLHTGIRGDVVECGVRLDTITAYASCRDRGSTVLRRYLPLRFQTSHAPHDVERRIYTGSHDVTLGVLHSVHDEHDRISGYIVLVAVPRSRGKAKGRGGFYRPDGTSTEPEFPDQLLHDPTIPRETVGGIDGSSGGQSRSDRQRVQRRQRRIGG